ncbi:aminotransferase class I/II-fold pyridoxal phosphate-dependent enzyme [Enterococcus montenegrensis]|uniref:methionine gamma-lyase family protein n=1 Tax=Enterococcus montenegrensis TaxID=3031993 RepID=UPI00249F30A2|nr:aminotransferase class I/II-fold pyridoxal phosphate-dependent enzyme [Enterococcus montenegrensis]WHA08611.1 aminotransferase class I/II-fold pyridoxal phosphate-dependent enzyme [Enterococcus montenegrensis]
MNWTDEFNPSLVAAIERVEQKIAPRQEELRQIALSNQNKVLRAFSNQHISETHFLPSTGYGNDDMGRDALEAVYAETFGTQAALVRPQIVSGTHAIATALFGVLRPGDELLYITGTPYDTLLEVIGLAGNGIGSMKEYDISYRQADLTDSGEVDFDAVKAKINQKTKVVAIQRSRGYAARPSFTIAKIKEMCDFVKTIAPDVTIFVDNCYGEFAELLEPTQVGADLMAGSLIKNPGGGIAKTGGYLVGKKDLIEKCAYRLTTPGVGAEGGAMLGNVYDMLQGFFLAPHVVSQAIQGAVFTSALLAEYAIASTPKWDDPRTDLIQLVELKEKDAMITFAQAIQRFSPVDAFVAPVPSYMPGYEDDIIMAAGTFVQGASIELSADGPLREPFSLYVQGGLTYEHVKIAVANAVNAVFHQNKK